MMYYLIVLISVLMFGGCFALNDLYRDLRSSSIASSMESAFIGSVASLVVLLIYSGFSFEATPFTLLIAALSAVAGLGFTFCSFKALDITNLSLYSLFSMLGGMMLPFLQGIVFYGEKITIGKIVCVIFVCISLCLTISRGKKKKGTIYYFGIFLLNGLAGVLSKIFTSANYSKTSAEWFSIWCAFFAALISGIVWLFVRRKETTPKYTFKAFSIAAANGSINRIANLMLVVSLLHLDASIQYPMVTGGVIIVSAVISLFSKRKPTIKELLSVLMAFVGLLALFIIKV